MIVKRKLFSFIDEDGNLGYYLYNEATGEEKLFSVVEEEREFARGTKEAGKIAKELLSKKGNKAINKKLKRSQLLKEFNNHYLNEPKPGELKINPRFYKSLVDNSEKNLYDLYKHKNMAAEFKAAESWPNIRFKKIKKSPMEVHEDARLRVARIVVPD